MTNELFKSSFFNISNLIICLLLPNVFFTDPLLIARCLNHWRSQMLIFIVHNNDIGVYTLKSFWVVTGFENVLMKSLWYSNEGIVAFVNATTYNANKNVLYTEISRMISQNFFSLRRFSFRICNSESFSCTWSASYLNR